MGYWIILGFFTLVGWLISSRLKGKFNRYSKMPVASRLSGAEIAAKMLGHYGIHDVQIVEGKGVLSDHYNPMNKTIALSPAVFQGRNVAAAAVAAHECGHAVQHAEAYELLMMRSRLVPVVQFSSRVQQMLFIGMLVGMGVAGGALGNMLMLALVITFGLTALFALVTLPVEFDASRRALVWLDESGVARGVEYDGAKDALWWAAMTYVSNALASLVIFLFFMLQFMNRD